MSLGEPEVKELRQLEESLWRAETRFDLEYLNRVLAPDFFEFGRSGRIYRREDALAVPAEDGLRTKFPLRDFAVHSIDANVVLVTYVSEVMYEVLEVGNRSSLWSKTPDGWQL